MIPPVCASKTRILVTAGPTREKIDPIRFISNYSTGLFGYEIAREAKARGYSVTLVSGPTSLGPPKGVKLIRVESAVEMERAILKEWLACDVIIMAAAVSDWRVEPAPKKIKRQGQPLALRLIENPDILKKIGKNKKGRVVVGFSLETDNTERNAIKKLKEKNLDLIIANRHSPQRPAFGDEKTSVSIIDRLGRVERVKEKTKKDLAKIILDRALNFRLC